MSDESSDSRKRRAEIVRLIVTSRERAPRSPRMERAMKRLIWRYSRTMREMDRQRSTDVQE